MRDPNRLPRNWEKLKELHAKYPDWRMGQFLMNVFNGFDFDPFYLEDDEFLKKVEEIVNSWSKNRG